MVHERTSFNFVKIHPMLHYAELVQRSGQLVKEITEMQEMNYPKMLMGPYCCSNRNFQWEWEVLNHYSAIAVLRMW